MCREIRLTEIERMLKERAKEIDAAIEKYIPRKFNENSLVFEFSRPRFSHNLEALDKAISEPIWEFLDRGGKRWRPSLFLVIIEALGKNPKEFLDFAIISEVIHNGTLIIDDIEDASEKRRGKPTTYRIFGLDFAINAGNAMYYLPLLVLFKYMEMLDPSTLNKLYNIYTQEMINISLGQAMDLAWHKGYAKADAISVEDYLQMCAYKTGTLARMSAKLAAVLAGAKEDHVEKLGRFAETIGIAFQIHDDILDLTGGRFAKGKGGKGMDISEGKRSLIVIHTLEHAQQSDRQRLLSILAMHTNNQEFRDEAIEIMRKYGSIDFARQFAVKMIRKTWNEVDEALPSSTAKDRLRDFAQYLINRDI